MRLDRRESKWQIFFWKIIFDLKKGPIRKKRYSENLDDFFKPNILNTPNKEMIKIN